MAQPKFRITHVEGTVEEITAHDVSLRDNWFYFEDGAGLVAQIRSSDVVRIDRM